MKCKEGEGRHSLNVGDGGDGKTSMWKQSPWLCSLRDTRTLFCIMISIDVIEPLVLILAGAYKG